MVMYVLTRMLFEGGAGEDDGGVDCNGDVCGNGGDDVDVGGCDHDGACDGDYEDDVGVDNECGVDDCTNDNA